MQGKKLGNASIKSYENYHSLLELVLWGWVEWSKVEEWYVTRAALEAYSYTIKYLKTVILENIIIFLRQNKFQIRQHSSI